MQIYEENSAGKIPAFYRKHFWNFQVVLVLAGIESIFFTVVIMGLCFGFVLKTVLIIDVSAIAELCLHNIKAACASCTAPLGRRLGVHKEFGGATADLN